MKFPEQLIYLAGPFTDPDPKVCAERAKQHARACAVLNHFETGFTTISPVAHGVAFSEFYKKQPDWQWWMRHCKPVFDACHRVAVLKIPGFLDSKGVKTELNWARSSGKPVFSVEFIPAADRCFKFGQHMSADEFIDIYWGTNGIG